MCPGVQAIARNAMTRIQTPIDHFVFSQCGSFCMSRYVFLLHRQSCCQVFCSNKLDHFFGLYFLFFAKMSQAEREEPTRRENQSKSETLQWACVEKFSDSPSKAFLSTSCSSSVGIHNGPHIYKCSPYHEEAERSTSKQKSPGNTPEKKLNIGKNRLDLRADRNDLRPAK